MFQRIVKLYHEFPIKFWTLVLASFIDRLGGTLIFPFFSLYITQKFNVGMTQAGVLLGLFSVFGLVGSMMGGALTDKFGRRGMVLFGLVFSALSSLSMGYVDDLAIFYVLAVFVGFLSNIGGPAQQAMVADLLPEQQRSEGFGILRVTANLAWIIGPTIGGFVATKSYLILFILDAVLSIVTAAIVYSLIPETQPEAFEDVPSISLLETFAGYRLVLKDGAYVAFLFTSMVMLVAYQQLSSTLSVYLRDVHGIPAQGYGFLMSMNAGTVVLSQFWVTRKAKLYPPMLMMALGATFYLFGFTLYGFVSAYILFVVAVLLITIGEMIVTPLGQALAANFAPEDMRGRYMACFSLSWAIPSTFAPWAAGLIMDNYNPNLVWYASGIVSAMAVVGFCFLHFKTRTAPTTSRIPLI